MVLQPPRHPCWMIANRRRVFPDAGSRDAFQSVFIHLQILLKLFLIVVADVISEIVVNPAAMTADYLSMGNEIVDPLLGFRIMQDVEAFVVPECINVRSS